MSAEQNLKKIQERLKALGRPGVKIVAVSKTHPPKRITELLRSGHRDFGENRQNEARDKVPLVNTEGLSPEQMPIYHHLGPLQSGSARQIPGLFSWVHGASHLSGIHSLATATEKFIQSPEAESMPDHGLIRYLIQVRLTGEETKLGGMEIDELRNIDLFPENEGLRFAGFMTMGPLSDNEEEVREVFARLKELRDEIFPEGELSMGMSGDWELAVQEGATIVRIGSTIFGRRNEAPWKPDLSVQ